MLFIAMCWFFLGAAIPNDVLILANGKRLPFDSYRVEAGRVQVSYQGETYSIPETLIDWDATKKAGDARRAQEEKQAKDQSKNPANRGQIPKKQNPINLTNKDFKTVKPTSSLDPPSTGSGAPAVNRNISLDNHGSTSPEPLSRYRYHLITAIRTVDGYASPRRLKSLSPSQRKEVLERLREADDLFNTVKNMLREERAMLQAKPNESTSEGGQTASETNKSVNCTFSLDKYVNEFMGFNKLVMQAVKNGFTPAMSRRLAAKVRMVRNALKPADACYPGLAAMDLK